MWVFPKIVGFPRKSSHFNRVFHYNHPFWGTFIFGNTHVDFHDFPSFLMFNRLTQPNPTPLILSSKNMPLQEKNRAKNDNPILLKNRQTPSISVSIRRSNSFCKACVSLSRANWAHLHASTWWHVRFARPCSQTKLQTYGSKRSIPEGHVITLLTKGSTKPPKMN